MNDVQNDLEVKMNPFNFDIETMNNNHTEYISRVYKVTKDESSIKTKLHEIQQLLSSAAFNMTEELELNDKTDFIHGQINKAIIKIVEIQDELDK